MEKVKSANKQSRAVKSFYMQPKLTLNLTKTVKLNVQQVLHNWYNLLKDDNSPEDSSPLFTALSQENLSKSLKSDLELVPSRLMDELVNEKDILDKGQYLRLVQALLVNISDFLFTKPGEFLESCFEIENVLEFIQDFFYQFFDFEYRATKYCVQNMKDLLMLKFDYWKIKLHQSPLLEAIQDCVSSKMLLPERYLTCRKVNYLKNLFQLIEPATNIITEEYIRQLCICYNFNDACFIDYETTLIKKKLSENNDPITVLKEEQLHMAQLKIKTGISFEVNNPSVKSQLHDWISAEIKKMETAILKKEDKDLVIDPEAKIQTSLSVAKLAVIIRLLVVDRIIINKSIAPMLRTVAKLFTTLQKDEISFGSLETKYHAPDKSTLSIVKEMLQKWVTIIGKL